MNSQLSMESDSRPTGFRRIFSRLRIAALLFCAVAVPTKVWALDPPMLISVTPADGANGVGSTAPLVFVFDQDMDTTVVSVPSSTGFTGNFSIVPSNLNMFGTWGADKRTLTIKPG